MLCIINGYLAIIRSYQRDSLLVINQDFHLSKKENGISFHQTPESLHNLKSEPDKAYQIVSHMKNVLKGNGSEKKDIDSLETLLGQDVSYNYQSDPDALRYAQSVISRMIELATDDSQFSAFTYF